MKGHLCIRNDFGSLAATHKHLAIAQSRLMCI